MSKSKSSAITVSVFAHNDLIYFYPSRAEEVEHNFYPTGKGRMGCVLVFSEKNIFVSRAAIDLMRQIKIGRDTIGDISWYKSAQGYAFSWFGPIYRVMDPKTAESSRDFSVRAGTYTEIPNKVPREILDAKVDPAVIAWRRPQSTDDPVVDVIAGA